MKLYHGSKVKENKLESRQAQTEERIDVLNDEPMNGIYLTPDYVFAVAMATRPEGVTEIDDENKIIEFNNPELFKPDEDVFIYVFESDKISKENLKYVDEKQYIVQGVDYLLAEEVKIIRAREVMKYYELKNWKENTELNKEQKMKFK